MRQQTVLGKGKTVGRAVTSLRFFAVPRDCKVETGAQSKAPSPRCSKSPLSGVKSRYFFTFGRFTKITKVSNVSSILGTYPDVLLYCLIQRWHKSDESLTKLFTKAAALGVLLSPRPPRRAFKRHPPQLSFYVSCLYLSQRGGSRDRIERIHTIPEAVY